MQRRTVLQLGSLLGLTGVHAFAHAKGTPFKFNLGWKFEASGAGYLLAQKRGYYSDLGLDVTIDSGNGSAGAVSLVASNAYDAASADLASLIELKSRNPSAGLKAVAIQYDLNPNAVIVRKGGPIQSPKDFIGKRILGQPFNASRKLFAAFAKAQGFDTSSVIWENLDPSTGEARFVKGDFDGMATFFFTGSLNLEAKGMKPSELEIFRFSDFGIESYGNGIVASAKAQENPDALRAFIAGSTQGWLDAIADPVAAAAAVKERDPLVNVGVETKRLELIINGTMRTPSTQTQGWGAAENSRIQATIDETVAALGLARAPSASEVWTDIYLPAQERRLVKI